MKKISLILAGILFSCSLQAVNDESNIGNGVESDQIQMRKRSKKAIKKSIEKTGEATLITEYDQQGNIIKIRDSYCSYCPSVEFTFKDGKIVSAKGGNKLYCEASVNKQNNTATYCVEGGAVEVEFSEFGYKKDSSGDEGASGSSNYEYNKDGLLVRRVDIYEEYSYDDYPEISTEKTITKYTYTYDVMSQDWTKRTATDNKGNKIVTTRTVEYW
ncbi:MAG: hypothetical protein UIG52_01925 [Bacteroidales bacterium]|nr:hypothetical protein [Bacteroidales bacterium]